MFLLPLRLFWTFPGAHVAFFIRTRLLHRNEKRITLAAAIPPPRIAADGSEFPHCDLIVFLTFAVIW